MQLLVYYQCREPRLESWWSDAGRVTRTLSHRLELFAIECVRAVKAPTLRLRSIHAIEILTEVEIFGRRTKDNATRQPDCDVWPRAKTQPQLEPPRFDINFVALSGT
ncbi:hypothetical protein A0H81_06421 [Grifola frondosa]|uniref:Uncharacterized protein n=1 Tax=Grifola frondosa TaxID=5627 RepID=A0A1C7MBQ7_GRIFR|nr:hypothetical protein A0H81_06421 [Grifola frondosa]